MQKFINLLLTLLVTTSLSARQRVAVVLSGGGAKGMAHIGALKVIEETGIPVDIIVGTSMGSIIGGLYAIGYTPNQLDSIVMAQNWQELLSDKQERKKISLEMREHYERYVLSLPFFEKPQDAISGGVIRGRNIGKMLWQLTEGYHKDTDFTKLPTPFACVSQDIVSGKTVIHDSGILPLAIRSSMSIPGVFAPIELDNQLLVDGGIINNYPVDVARRMGADIVIGVDVQDTLKNIQALRNSIKTQLSQLIDLQGKDLWQKNIKNTDVYIHVDVGSYHQASFNPVAIDSLIERGYRAAQCASNELTELKKRIGPITNEDLKHPNSPHKPSRSFFLTPETEPSYRKLVGKTPTNSMNLGIRFDNEELAALIFNTQFTLPHKIRHSFGLTLRLGISTYGQLDYNFLLGKDWKYNFSYQIGYNSININDQGKRYCELSFVRHQLSTGFARSWKHWKLKIEAQYKYYNYGSFLYGFHKDITEDINTENHLRMGIDLGFNNMNDLYFPQKGHILTTGYHYIVSFNKYKPLHTVSLDWKTAVSPTRRFSILFRINGRYITSEQNTISELNTVGGQEPGKYFSQQIPFYGINRFETTHKILMVGGIEFRQRMGSRHYISLPLNIGLTTATWTHFFKNAFRSEGYNEGYHLWGAAIKYDLRTAIGPIGLTLHYSNRTRSVDGYVHAGFNF